MLILVAALGKADENAVDLVADHARGKAGDGIRLVQRGRDMPVRRLMQDREAGVAARAEHDIRPEAVENFIRTMKCTTDRADGADVVHHVLRMKAAQEVGDRQRFDRKALARDEIGLHTVVRADKQDVAARLALAQQLCNGERRVDVAAGAAAGENDIHKKPPNRRCCGKYSA